MSDETFAVTVQMDNYKLILLSPGGYGEGGAKCIMWCGNQDEFDAIDLGEAARMMQRQLGEALNA